MTNANLVSALGSIAQLAAKHPEILNVIAATARAALRAKNPWRAAIRTFMAEAGKRAAKELANELIQLRGSL